MPDKNLSPKFEAEFEESVQRILKVVGNRNAGQEGHEATVRAIVHELRREMRRDVLRGLRGVGRGVSLELETELAEIAGDG